MRILSGLLLTIAIATPASAQVSFGGDDPIDVKAERAAYKGPKTILTGDVQVLQGTSQIHSQRMDLFREKISKDNETDFSYGNINRIVAVGDFKYITPENSVKGNRGVYERDKNIITVTGNVVFTQKNGNSATGDKLTYDLTTNRARFASTCSGQECDNSDRVEIKIGQ
jgi:lipopolysaccharide export system protein LptA